MMPHHSRSARLGRRLSAALIGSLLAIPAVAWAASSVAPTDPEVIYACFIPQNGNLYRIKATDPTETCKSPQHLQIQWNITGPAGAVGAAGPVGPQGPAGVQGPTGPIGPAGAPGVVGPAGVVGLKGVVGVVGPAGVVGIEVVKVTETKPLGQSDYIGRATCPAGKKLLGGGFAVVPNVGRVTKSRPEGNNEWYMYLEQVGLTTPDVTTYAICAPWP